MSKKKTIADVEYVADAIILGHLRAVQVNIDYAVKDFKRHHFELKGTDMAKKFAWLRSLTKQVLDEFVVHCNEEVRGQQLKLERKKMSGKWRKRLRGLAHEDNHAEV